MSATLSDRCVRALEAAGCDLKVSDLAARLIGAWREPHRRYHGVTHLEHCLRLSREMRAQAERPAELDVALIFHDAIYDTRVLDNETRSADWARESLVRHGARQFAADRVAEMVLATKTHESSTSADAALLLDIDLSILGAERDDFARFEAGIREEYRWVEEAHYRLARARVLESFLERPQLYQTAEMRERLERRARMNLRGAIEALGGEG